MELNEQMLEHLRNQAHSLQYEKQDLWKQHWELQERILQNQKDLDKVTNQITDLCIQNIT